MNHTPGPSSSILTADLAAGVLLLLLLQVRGIGLMLLLVVAALIVAGRMRAWGPPAVLVALIYLLFQSDADPLGIDMPRYADPLSLTEMALTVSYLVYATFAYRAMSSVPSSAEPSADNSSRLVGDLLVAVAIGWGVVVVARWALPYLFFGRTLVETFRLHPAVLGFIVAIVLIGLVSLVWPGLVRTVGRRGMNVDQARMILNETVHQDLRSDWKRIARLWKP
jgi:hypothetical protein